MFGTQHRLHVFLFLNVAVAPVNIRFPGQENSNFREGTGKSAASHVQDSEIRQQEPAGG